MLSQSNKPTLVNSVPQAAMPIQASSESKREVELVSERVAKTKNEIEQLKVQLQKLIDDGIKVEVRKAPTDEIKINSEAKVNKSPIPKKHTSLNKRSEPEQIPKRIRHYDKKAAREYIKKQREERKELLKNNKPNKTAHEDLKKQRLQELRLKTLELVSKNIQHKRDRSKVIIQNKTVDPQLKNVRIRSPLKTDQEIVVEPVEITLKHSEATPASKEIFEDLQKQIFPGVTSKEVQTHWPEMTASSLPYPYNFISAVRKKLNLAVQELGEKRGDPKPLSKTIDLKSFLSHKCLEKAIVSDSDTSKNIPDISSESLSIKRTANNIMINTEEVKRLKLRRPKKINFSLAAPEEDSKRNSIISSNKCDYGDKISKPIELPNNSLTSFKEYMKKLNNDTPEEYSTNFTNASESIPKLQAPSLSLSKSKRDSQRSTDIVTESISQVTDQNLTVPQVTLERSQASTEPKRTNQTVCLKAGEKTSIDTKINSNEIHLKFEAELHLLNEFNDSLRQVMAVEKSLLELQHNNKNYQTQDTQTSVIFEEPEDTEFSDFEVLSTKASENTRETVETVSIIKEQPMGLAGVSLDMFDHLIKDEDARIENLKTILKLREKALVDRTKGELAWLEIQKKHLRDLGQLQQISAIKKKQRGLLIKLEHERHEMQRLKQMQKAASKERKTALKEHRNMIKAQLSTSNTLTKIKRKTCEERRQSGPLKVYNIKSHTESVTSETSRRSSITEEILNVVSHSHSVVTEEYSLEEVNDELPTRGSIKTEFVRRSLLSRETALQKRRKAAEELLQWHQRLTEEESKITELEQAANAIVNQTKEKPAAFKGSQLNLLWLNMTGREEKKFDDISTYTLSKNEARNTDSSIKAAEASPINTSLSSSTPESIPTEIYSTKVNEYTSDFEVDALANEKSTSSIIANTSEHINDKSSEHINDKSSEHIIEPKSIETSTILEAPTITPQDNDSPSTTNVQNAVPSEILQVESSSTAIIDETSLIEENNLSDTSKDIETPTKDSTTPPKTHDSLLNHSIDSDKEIEPIEEIPSTEHSSSIVSEEKDTEITFKSGETDSDSAIEEVSVERQSESASSKSTKEVDVKKRISEILADAHSPRSEKSPRVQDLYTTTYDIGPESDSPIEEAAGSPPALFGSDEVEELLKKQLAIEQEIKEIQEQQKEQLPYLYVREIPNKPPPPYTPPNAVQSPVGESFLPLSETQIIEITETCARILHNAYNKKDLVGASLKSGDSNSNSYEFVFDLCKEIALEHYGQFEPQLGPSWLHVTKKSKLALGRPLTEEGLEKLMSKRVKQYLGYEIVLASENASHKWSGKKRDHVDELLVLECQAEETDWTNYDRDEPIVKDRLTEEILNMLLKETASDLHTILAKKK